MNCLNKKKADIQCLLSSSPCLPLLMFTSSTISLTLLFEQIKPTRPKVFSLTASFINPPKKGLTTPVNNHQQSMN